MNRLWIAVVLCGCASAQSKPVTIPTQADPDALYSSAVRELVNAGYEPATKDKDACVVSTGWQMTNAGGGISSPERERITVNCSGGKVVVDLQVENKAVGTWTRATHVPESKQRAAERLAESVAAGAR